jgi:hypothetical protein
MARLGLIEINDTNVSFVEKNIPLCELRNAFSMPTQDLEKDRNQTGTHIAMEQALAMNGTEAFENLHPS